MSRNYRKYPDLTQALLDFFGTNPGGSTQMFCSLTSYNEFDEAIKTSCRTQHSWDNFVAQMARSMLDAGLLTREFDKVYRYTVAIKRKIITATDDS